MITLDDGLVITGTVVGVHRDYVAVVADPECAGAISRRRVTPTLSPPECHARRLLEAVDVAANVLADADLANREDPAAYPGVLPPAVARALAHAVHSLVELLPYVLVPLEVGAPAAGREGGAARQVAIQLHLQVRRLVVRLESSAPAEPRSP